MVPVFTVDSEIAYLSAFTNSVMVEISRLDAITSNKMKSDFISSISHEVSSSVFISDHNSRSSRNGILLTFLVPLTVTWHLGFRGFLEGMLVWHC